LALEFLDALKEFATTECPPIVILNGLGDAVTMELFAAHPEVRAILPKPLQGEEILRIVQHVIGHRLRAYAGPFRRLENPEQ
jgi:hypothetical protein